MGDPRHCLICDDHPLVAQALHAAVAARWPAMGITLAEDYPAALGAIGGVDLALVDLDMPGATPRDGIAALRAAAPATPLIIVTGSGDDALLLDLLALGIAGFVPKTATLAVIAAAIELVLAGGRYLPPRLAEMAASPRLAEMAASPPGPALAAALSPRQVEVVALLARGLSNKDIARTLGVAPATVKSHVTQVMNALGATNRTDAAVRARAAGIV
jgi:DNA-binding NarL/FixJ family response regulator